MAKNYKVLTESINARLNPENITLTKAFSDELGTISYSDVLVFIRTAMKGVEPEYTNRSKMAGDRVKEHLDKALTSKAFRYQGSVMTNTHIKGVSDIDLLVISDKFYTYDSSGINSILNNPERKKKFYSTSITKMESVVSTSNYTGNTKNDLLKLRTDSESTLLGIYKICDVSKSKSIKIKNLDLNREVDIVIANWYDDVTSIINDKGSDYRGVQVYDKDTNSKGNADYPFLSIKRINTKSSSTNGRLKKMIRFLKNVKALSDKDIGLSSFDFNAICYDIEESKYSDLSFHELVPVIYDQLYKLSTDSNYSDRLVSVDGREYIFKYDTVKLNNLKALMEEVKGILLDYYNANKNG